MRGISLRRSFVEGREVLELRQGKNVVRLSAKQQIYVTDIANEFDAYLSAVFPAEFEGVRLIDFSEPHWHRLRPSGREMLFTSFTEGEAVCETYLKYGQLSPGDTVLDLGANCGLASLAFSRAVGPQGRVIAVEPDPGNFDALQQNLIRHAAANVTAIKKGVWSGPGRVVFDSDGTMGAFVVQDNRPFGIRGNRIEIDVVSIMSLVQDLGLEKIDFVKMDIEGSEAVVVEASREFLRQCKCPWLIEVHDPASELGPICAVFKECGYSAEVIEQSKGHNFPLLHCRPL